jgi:putative phage-type endonuclease
MYEDEEAVEIVDGPIALPSEIEVAAQMKADIADRRTFIGGSDAPVILGLVGWKTRFELYQEKIGEKEPDDLSDVERVQWGIILEDSVAQMYMRRTGKKVRRVNNRVVNKDSPFPSAAQIDRHIVGGGVLEIKTTDASNGAEWGPEGSSEIPPHYYAQVQHQLKDTREPFAEVAVLIGGNRMRLYIVPRDEEFIADLTTAELAFWELCMARTPPDPISLDEATLRWGRAPSQPVIGTQVHGAVAAELAVVKEEKKAIEARESGLELELKKALQDLGDTLMVDGIAVCTWKEQNRTGIDTTALKARAPDVASEFEKTTTFRVFRLGKTSGFRRAS